MGMDLKSTAQSADFQENLASLIRSSISWLSDGNLQMILMDNGVEGVRPDFNKLTLAGHSAGGHTVTQLLSDDCSGVSALVYFI